MSDPSFCRLSPADAVDLAGLEALCFSEPWSQEMIESELALPVTSGFGWRDPAGGGPMGLDVDRPLVAYALFRVIAPEAELARIGVPPTLRRRGLAHRLLACSLSRLERTGVDSVHLEVRAGNRAARALYRRFGFETMSIRPGYYSDGSDALVLRRDRLEGSPEPVISSGHLHD